MFILNTFLGFLTVQIADVLKRSKKSRASPKKLSINFFWRDNWLKIVLSLSLSIVLSLTTHLNFDAIVSSVWDGNAKGLIYWAVGAVPEYVLQKLKKKLGIAQPEKVTVKNETFDRL